MISPVNLVSKDSSPKTEILNQQMNFWFAVLQMRGIVDSEQLRIEYDVSKSHQREVR